MKITKELFEEQVSIANEVYVSFYHLYPDTYKNELEHLKEELKNPNKSTVKDGVLYWILPNEMRIVPMDVAGFYYTKMHGNIDLVKHSRALKKANEKFIKSYREQMANHKPSEEELAEMRSAFGESTEVINVFTGQVTKL